MILLPISGDARDKWVWSLGWEDPLEEKTATHSSGLLGYTLAATVHGVAKSHRHDWVTEHTGTCWGGRVWWVSTLSFQLPARTYGPQAVNRVLTLIHAETWKMISHKLSLFLSFPRWKQEQVKTNISFSRPAHGALTADKMKRVDNSSWSWKLGVNCWAPQLLPAIWCSHQVCAGECRGLKDAQSHQACRQCSLWKRREINMLGSCEKHTGIRDWAVLQSRVQQVIWIFLP